MSRKLRFTRPVLIARFEWLCERARNASGYDQEILDAQCHLATRYWLRAFMGA